MKLRKTLAAAGALAIAGSLVAIQPSTAAPGDTAVTFVVSAGGLSIAAQPTADLSAAAVAAGGTLAATIGDTTVTDTRGALAQLWTVTATSAGFTTPDNGGGTIAATQACMFSGAAGTDTSSVFVPTVDCSPTAAAGTNLSGAGMTVGTSIATSLLGVIGSNAVTYNPTLKVVVPANAKPGTYTGTVSQTVA